MDFIKELGELALGSRLKRLIENLRSNVKDIYRLYGIDFEPFLMPIINLLSKNECLQITQIADNLRISQPAVTQFCNALNKKGLIDLSSHSFDQRKKEVRITKIGLDLVETLKPIWDEISKEIKIYGGGSIL